MVNLPISMIIFPYSLKKLRYNNSNNTVMSITLSHVLSFETHNLFYVIVINIIVIFDLNITRTI